VREVEVKAVVSDEAATRARVEAAGATLVFAGKMRDRRFDTADRWLIGRDAVLRLRTYEDSSGGGSASAQLHWKGATSYDRGYKVREELSTATGDAAATEAILERLGYMVTREIDRTIAQYMLFGASLRFERYPRMDMLLEIEGEPAAIERSIAAVGLAREEFSSDRLMDFVARYERRTGERAALSDRELAGDFRYSVNDG
jgi:adenylate cyclase class IV